MSFLRMFTPADGVLFDLTLRQTYRNTSDSVLEVVYTFPLPTQAVLMGFASELNGERNRGLYILKSRGMAHSNQIREFLLSDRGVQLTEVYLGPEGVLTGSTRLAQEAKEKATAVQRSLEIERKRGELTRRQQALEAQIAVLQLQFQTDKEEMEQNITGEQAYLEKLEEGRHDMARSRKAHSNGLQVSPKKGRK